MEGRLWQGQRVRNLADTSEQITSSGGNPVGATVLPSIFDMSKLSHQSGAQQNSTLATEAGTYEALSGADGGSLQREAMAAALSDSKTQGTDSNMDRITNALFTLPLGLPIDR